MPRPKTKVADEIIRPEYTRMLKGLVEAEPPLENKELEDETGMSRQTIWRVLTHDNARLESTFAIWKAVRKLRGDDSIPPPLVSVSYGWEPGWLALGNRLNDLNPARFERIRNILSQLIDAQETDARTMTMLSDMVSPDTKE